METLKGSIAVVTGAGRLKGIGAAICRELAKNGSDIFFTYWHQYDTENHSEAKDENPVEFVEELTQFGVRVASAEIDLSKADSAEALIKMVAKELGLPNILINNAVVSTHQPFQEVTAELLDDHYAVNIRATTLLCKEFVASQGGKDAKIINLTSGQDLGVMKDELPYTITKAGVDMLTRQLGPELLEKGITINALDPGPTDTGWMTNELKEQIKKDSKKGRINMPEDTAKLIVKLLCSDKHGEVVHAEW